MGAHGWVAWICHGPCSHHCAIPALITVPSLLPSLCHPCSHHCSVPAPITLPSLLSSLFRPCSYYFAIPALINNARVYASITVPSPLSSLWPRSLLSSLCHPHSHHCAIPSCYFIDSTLLDHTDDTPFWTWFTKS